MKYLNKFVEYIKENNETLDIDLIVNDFLVPIKHLGVDVSTHESIETSGDFQGHNVTTIKLGIKKLDRVNRQDNTNFKDSKIWDLLDEIIMFKNVISETYNSPITIWFSMSSISIDIYTKLKNVDDSYLIKKLYNDFIKYDNRTNKIHFDMSSDESSITGYIKGTKRVWENYIKESGIDISKYNLKFEDTPDNVSYWSLKSKTMVTITVK